MYIHEFYNFIFLLIQLYILGVVFYFIEKIRPAQVNIKFFKNDFKTEIFYPLFNNVFTGNLLGWLILVFFSLISEKLLPHNILTYFVGKMPWFLQLFTALLVLDLIIYIKHRFFHVFMWDYHAVHHVPDEINWITSYRLHPVEVVLGAALKYFTLYIIGFSADIIVYAGYVIFVFNIITHANINLDYGYPLRYLLASPNYHRWHHAIDSEAINKNFVVVFPFIDILFGTYYFPNKLPVKYGIYSSNEYNEVPKGFVAQMLHPFKKLIKK